MKIQHAVILSLLLVASVNNQTTPGGNFQVSTTKDANGVTANSVANATAVGDGSGPSNVDVKANSNISDGANGPTGSIGGTVTTDGVPVTYFNDQVPASYSSNNNISQANSGNSAGSNSVFNSGTNTAANSNSTIGGIVGSDSGANTDISTNNASVADINTEIKDSGSIWNTNVNNTSAANTANNTDAGINVDNSSTGGSTSNTGTASNTDKNANTTSTTHGYDIGNVRIIYVPIYYPNSTSGNGDCPCANNLQSNNKGASGLVNNKLQADNSSSQNFSSIQDFNTNFSNALSDYIKNMYAQTYNKIMTNINNSFAAAGIDNNAGTTGDFDLPNSSSANNTNNGSATNWNWSWDGNVADLNKNSIDGFSWVNNGTNSNDSSASSANNGNQQIYSMSTSFSSGTDANGNPVNYSSQSGQIRVYKDGKLVTSYDLLPTSGSINSDGTNTSGSDSNFASTSANST